MNPPEFDPAGKEPDGCLQTFGGVRRSIWLFYRRLENHKFNRGRQQRHHNQNLHEQDGGHSVEKIPVPRLVAEQVHTDDRADAAADDGEHEKRGFRDAPCALSRFEFIDAHHREAYEVDND